MDIIEHTKTIREERMKLIEEAKGVYDDAIEAKRAVSTEEEEKVKGIDSRIAEIEAEVRNLDEQERRERDSATAREAFERQYGKPGADRKERSEMEEFRAWAQGRETRQNAGDPDKPGGNTWSVNIRAAQYERDLIRQGLSGEELRTVLWDTGTSGSLVPTILDRTLYQYMEAEIAALRMNTTKITTAGGEPLNFPKVLAHGIATQVIAQGTAIGGTDPTFSYMHLDAFKYGQLVQVASEVIQDSAVDILGFVGSNIGRAVGRLIDQHLIVGTGTGQPQGMMTLGTGSAGTIPTGGTLIAPSYEVLVNAVYGVADAYRNNSSTAWLMHDSTAGTLRKLRDGAGGTVGAVLWRPSLTEGIQGGQPGLLLDYPVYTDAYVATAGSNARLAAFGDWNAYYTRLVGDFVIERSDDFAFNVDLATFRGKQRVDGDFIDTTATNIIKQSVT
jgi:HK97 family phage major capsid protein